jgi:hypothetical protein
MIMLHESAKGEDASVGLLRLTSACSGGREARFVYISQYARGPADACR